MAKIYSRVTKINNVVGRSDYISNSSRQEFIELTGKSSDFDWIEYAAFEKVNQRSQEKNNEARELVIALPNGMRHTFTDDVLEKFSHDLAQELLGKNRDYEFALHFNKLRTNFHMHLLFSERERISERKPKVYKRDMWFDKTTNRMAKVNAENAELRYKKGQVMKDKEGNIRYDDAPFTKKDKKFTERSWIKSHQKKIQKVFSEYDYVLDLFDSKHEIAQKKLYKGASSDYIEYAQHWNRAAIQANKTLNKERSTLLDEYNVLKPLMDEYRPFADKEEEMRQADLNLKIYNKNGYSGYTWNVFERAKYFIMNYEKDKTNVKIYDDLRDKIYIAAFNKDNFRYRHYTPTKYFRELVQKIQRFPKRVKELKDTMIKRYGTIDRYKSHQQERTRKEFAKQQAKEQARQKEKERQDKFNRRMDQLRAKNTSQRSETTKQRPPKRRSGPSR